MKLDFNNAAKREIRLAKGELAHFCDLFYGSKIAPLLTIGLCSVVIVAYFVCHVGSFW